jgi:hypothetical protein
VVLLSLLAAVLVGWARGGSLERLGALPLRSRRLLVLAFLAQLAGVVVGGPFHALGPGGVRGAGRRLPAAQPRGARHRPAGARPAAQRARRGRQRRDAGVDRRAARAGVSTPRSRRADPRHELADRSTRLPWLADVVPVPLPGRPRS